MSAYTRNDRLFVAASVLVTIVFAVMFTGSGFGLRAAWPFWASLLCTSVFIWMPLLRQRVAGRDRVDFNEHGIERIAAGGTREAVRWDAIDRIFIATERDAATGEDTFWVFVDHSGRGGCAVPDTADGFDALRERVRRLEGFDEAAVEQARRTDGPARVDVWRRADA